MVLFSPNHCVNQTTVPVTNGSAVYQRVLMTLSPHKNSVNHSALSRKQTSQNPHSVLISNNSGVPPQAGPFSRGRRYALSYQCCKSHVHLQACCFTCIVSPVLFHCLAVIMMIFMIATVFIAVVIGVYLCRLVLFVLFVHLI